MAAPQIPLEFPLVEPATDPALAAFHPLVQRWFEQTLGEPSEPQRQGWPLILSSLKSLLETGETLPLPAAASNG